MKFASPNRNAQVRRNRCPQRNWNPSVTRERSDERSGSRVSWNGARIASSETVEKA
jgi:hypothetical protein